MVGQSSGISRSIQSVTERWPGDQPSSRRARAARTRLCDPSVSFAPGTRGLLDRPRLHRPEPERIPQGKKKSARSSLFEVEPA